MPRAPFRNPSTTVPWSTFWPAELIACEESADGAGKRRRCVRLDIGEGGGYGRDEGQDLIEEDRDAGNRNADDDGDCYGDGKQRGHPSIHASPVEPIDDRQQDGKNGQPDAEHEDHRPRQRQDGQPNNSGDDQQPERRTGRRHRPESRVDLWRGWQFPVAVGAGVSDGKTWLSLMVSTLSPRGRRPVTQSGE